MIELNKPYKYKNKIVYPSVFDGSQFVCFDDRGRSLFVKNESDLTKIENIATIIEPTYIKKEDIVVVPVVETKVVDPVVEEKKEEIKVETKKEEEKKNVIEDYINDDVEIDNNKVETKKIERKKKRVNITENEYI